MSEKDKEKKNEIFTSIKVLKSRKQENEGKSEMLHERIRKAKESIKKKTDELHSAKEKLPFKKVEDVDRRISSIEKQLETSSRTLNQEKTLVQEISKLKKTRKLLEQLDSDSDAASVRHSIDLMEQDHKELQKERRILQDEIGAYYTQLKAFGGDRTERDAQRKELFAERDRLQNQLNEIYQARRDLFAEFKVEQDKVYEEIRAEWAKKQEHFRVRDLEKKIEELTQSLDEFGVSQHDSDINNCVHLLNYFSTSSDVAAEEQKKEIRKIDDDNLPKGIPVVTKYDRNEVFYMGNPRKAKKEKKSKVEKTKQFSVPFHVLSGLSDLAIKAPESVEDVPMIVEALKTKKAEFEKLEESRKAKVQSEADKINAKIAELRVEIATVPPVEEYKPKPRPAKVAAV